jgi:hypothetical protein
VQEKELLNPFWSWSECINEGQKRCLRVTLSSNRYSYYLPLETAAAVELMTPVKPYENHVIGEGKDGLESEKRSLQSQVEPRTDNVLS